MKPRHRDRRPAMTSRVIQDRLHLPLLAELVIGPDNRRAPTTPSLRRKQGSRKRRQLTVGAHAAIRFGLGRKRGPGRPATGCSVFKARFWCQR